MQTSNRLLF